MLAIGSGALGAVLGWLADVSAGRSRIAAAILIVSLASAAIFLLGGSLAAGAALAGALAAMLGRIALLAALAASADPPHETSSQSAGR